MRRPFHSDLEGTRRPLECMQQSQSTLLGRTTFHRNMPALKREERTGSTSSTCWQWQRLMRTTSTTGLTPRVSKCRATQKVNCCRQWCALREQQMDLLGLLSCTVVNTRASNCHHQWRLFTKATSGTGLPCDRSPTESARHALAVREEFPRGHPP